MSPTDCFRIVHTRDSGKPVLINILTTGPVKPAMASEGNGGTAMWVLGRQDPFYIRESMEEFYALWSKPMIGFSTADAETLVKVERPAAATLGGPVRGPGDPGYRSGGDEAAKKSDAEKALPIGVKCPTCLRQVAATGGEVCQMKDCCYSTRPAVLPVPA